MDKLLGITELTRLLNLINPKTKKPLNHTLRFWEKEFKQIKPQIINKRRYYTKKQIDFIKLINRNKMNNNLQQQLNRIKRIVNRKIHHQSF